MGKRLTIAALLAVTALASVPSARALPPSQWCEFVEDADLFIRRTGLGTREEQGFDCVLVFYLRGLETATLQMSDEVQRARVILTDEHPFIDGEQDVVVKNQMGCCVEVDANGYLLTIERTGLFGDDFYLTLFVDGHKVVQCPWTEEDGPEFDECRLDPIV